MSDTAKPFSPSVRRIVLGHSQDGSVAVQDEAEQNFVAIIPGVESAPIWRTHEIPCADHDYPATTPNSVFDRMQGLISSNGTNCFVTDLAPGATIPSHRTHSVDYNIITHGQITLISPDGIEKVLNPGDIVFQRGGIHEWMNRGTEWVRWVAVVVDAKPFITPDGKELPEGWAHTFAQA